MILVHRTCRRRTIPTAFHSYSTHPSSIAGEIECALFPSCSAIDATQRNATQRTQTPERESPTITQSRRGQRDSLSSSLPTCGCPQTTTQLGFLSVHRESKAQRASKQSSPGRRSKRDRTWRVTHACVHRILACAYARGHKREKSVRVRKGEQRRLSGSDEPCPPLSTGETDQQEDPRVS